MLFSCTPGTWAWFDLSSPYSQFFTDSTSSVVIVTPSYLCVVKFVKASSSAALHAALCALCLTFLRYFRSIFLKKCPLSLLWYIYAASWENPSHGHNCYIVYIYTIYTIYILKPFITFYKMFLICTEINFIILYLNVKREMIYWPDVALRILTLLTYYHASCKKKKLALLTQISALSSFSSSRTQVTGYWKVRMSGCSCLECSV